MKLTLFEVGSFGSLFTYEVTALKKVPCDKDADEAGIELTHWP
jgi:hypothetical protein